MHELSIAEALIEQVRRHTPEGSRAFIVRVEAGPLQAIDPDALEMAWRSVTAGTELAQARLDFENLPYILLCPRCDHSWTSHDAFELCDCGAEARAVGCTTLRLNSMEVESLPLYETPLHQEV